VKALAALALVALLLAAACGLPPEQFSGPRPGLPVAPIVRIGSGGSLFDAALLLAASRGYYASEGLDVQVVELPSPAAVLWPVVAGQLDAGTTSPSVELFDALAREQGAPRIVASAGQARPGQSPAALLLRPALAARPALDLHARPIGAPLYDLGGRNVALALAGLGLDGDAVYLVDLLADQAAAALAEGRLDAAYAVEPDVARLVAAGQAVRWLGVDELDPGQELAVLLFSPNLVANRPGIAARLLAAYRRALGDYRAAVTTGVGRDAVLRELAGPLRLDSRRALGALQPVAYPADGAPNVASLQATQEYYLEHALLGRPADLARAVDLRFLRADSPPLSPP
jgi:NitT/TauT family transport system substrate-binding protein